MSSAASDLTVSLVGAGGERVSLRSTLVSHGLAWLPPNEIAPGERRLTTTLALPDGTARTVTVLESTVRPDALDIVVSGRVPSAAARRAIVRSVRAMFSLDDDLSGFYASVAGDPDFAFARDGVGRMLRSPTAFEDVARTLCTTNCAWSATERMIEAIVSHLGTRAIGAPADGWRGRAFPSAARMAEADASFYRDVARAGYRGAYLRSLAEAVATGRIDLEAWRAASPAELPDDELADRLLALAGIGPYAAAHAMMLFGRCSRLVLDSWTRPRYAALVARKSVADRTIERRFKRYGEHAGRAFWLLLWKSRHLGLESRP